MGRRVFLRLCASKSVSLCLSVCFWMVFVRVCLSASVCVGNNTTRHIPSTHTITHVNTHPHTHTALQAHTRSTFVGTHTYASAHARTTARTHVCPPAHLPARSSPLENRFAYLGFEFQAQAFASNVITLGTQWRLAHQCWYCGAYANSAPSHPKCQQALHILANAKRLKVNAALDKCVAWPYM